VERTPGDGGVPLPADIFLGRGDDAQ